MRKLFFSLLLGIIIAICWVLIIHTLKWVAIQGNEFALTSQHQPQDELAKAKQALASSHRSIVLQPPLPSLPANVRLGRHLAAGVPEGQEGSPTSEEARPPPPPGSTGQPGKQTLPSSQLLKQISPDSSNEPGEISTSPISAARSARQRRLHENPGENENDDDDDGSDDGAAQPSIELGSRDGLAATPDKRPRLDHQRGRGHDRTRQPGPSSSATITSTPMTTEVSVNDWPHQAAPESNSERLSGEAGLAGDLDRPAQAAPSSTLTASAVGLPYRAPFFTSWFVSTWNILFMPVFTLISSCCFRNEDSNTKKLLV